jgi:hypothetical protein
MDLVGKDLKIRRLFGGVVSASYIFTESYERVINR